MTEKSRFRENMDSLWENRRKLAVLTVVGIIAVIYFSRNSGSTTIAPAEFAGDSLPKSAENLPSSGSSSTESAQSQPGQPDFVDLGPSGIYGITNGMVYGITPVQCATVNFPYSAYADGNIVDPKYEPGQPSITYAKDALNLLQVPYALVSDTNPIYVARGPHVVVVNSLQNKTLNMLNNDAKICAK
jgi:hypothetical protein